MLILSAIQLSSVISEIQYVNFVIEISMWLIFIQVDSKFSTKYRCQLRNKETDEHSI